MEVCARASRNSVIVRRRSYPFHVVTLSSRRRGRGGCAQLGIAKLHPFCSRPETGPPRQVLGTTPQAQYGLSRDSGNLLFNPIWTTDQTVTGGCKSPKPFNRSDLSLVQRTAARTGGRLQLAERTQDLSWNNLACTGYT